MPVGCTPSGARTSQHTRRSSLLPGEPACADSTSPKSRQLIAPSGSADGVADLDAAHTHHRVRRIGPPPVLRRCSHRRVAAPSACARWIRCDLENP